MRTRTRTYANPFFTTKERGNKSGLCLSTACGIIKQHGGFFHVYSELGQGTLFRTNPPQARAP
jgi:two-component system cell cycle sensor histidine kinase/response regulator CckA